MFARLVISDLFMHGIGGGKYDQMTDAIIRAYFDVPAPPMVVATATLRLPLADSCDWVPCKRTLKRCSASRKCLAHAVSSEQHIDSPNSETESYSNANVNCWMLSAAR